MRRSEKEIKSRDEIRDVMKKATVCRLGFVDGDMPYVVPVNFGFDDAAIYFHSAKEGRKLEILRRNNNVCFEMDADHLFVPAEKGCSWSMKFRSIIGNGKAHFIDDAAGKIAALKLIMAHYSDKQYEFTAEEAAKVVVIRIDIESIIGKKSGY